MAFGIDEPAQAPSAVKGVAVASPVVPPLVAQPVASPSVVAPPLAIGASPENQASRNEGEPTAASSSANSWTTVNVPVLVVLSQGILLGLVGVVAFGLGTWFGRAWEREARGGAAANTTLSPVKGKCVYRKTSGGEWIPDEGAVVLFVPVLAHVVQPAPLMGLRPGDDANLSRRGLAQLKEWGGARGVCQPDGTYEVSLNRDQDYWIIALSAHKRRAATSPVPLNEVRRTERYFSLVGDGFGPWEVKTAQKRVAGNDWFDFAF